MKFLFALLTIAFADRLLSDAEYATHFDSFVKTYEMNYTSGYEWASKYETFKDNMDKIMTHNEAKRSWTMGMNQFGDMTQWEFAQYIKRGNGGGFVPFNGRQPNVKEMAPATCSSVDWVSKGAVTPVKNQGQCGSCWSFSTTGGIEGRVQTAGKGLTSLSEQNLVDCDTKDSGCNGGLMDYGFQYVISNGGLCSEDAYKYVSGTTKTAGTCQGSTCGTKYGQITSFTDVKQFSQSDLESALCDGPVSIAIEADQNAFQFYNGGVMDGSCGANLDHGVLLVGMGTDSMDYWKIKNSWGGSWGESGYIRIKRGMNNNCLFGTYRCAGQCGLLKSASFPVV